MPSRAASNRFCLTTSDWSFRISMQFEAGGRTGKGTDSAFPKVNSQTACHQTRPPTPGSPIGYREGIPRMLDLWDRHGIKVTSHMIGEAVQRHPQLAKEIVERGHEAAGHGPRWSSQYAMSREEEREFLVGGTKMVEAATGQRPNRLQLQLAAARPEHAVAVTGARLPLSH